MKKCRCSIGAAALFGITCLVSNEVRGQKLPEFQHYNAEVDIYSSKGRNYLLAVTADECEDIRYILKCLATRSWTDLLGSRGSLNRAGDRIDHVHPLRFIMCILSDEEMKGCVHSIRDRKQIWKSFFSGLEESLEEESQRNNMKFEFVEDFSINLGINSSSIIGYIEDRDWPELVDVLLVLLPRQGEPGRYDM